MWAAAAPASISDLIVRWMLKADGPKPVSISTRSGRSQTAVILRTSTSTSSKVVIPKSGTPKDPAATPPPER